MLACPNTSSKEWKALSEKMGDDAAMLAFIRNNEQMPESLDVARELVTNVGLLKSLETIPTLTEQGIHDSLINQGLVFDSYHIIDGKKHYALNTDLPDIGKRLGAITDQYGAILEYKDEYVRVNPEAVSFWNTISNRQTSNKKTAVELAKSFLTRIGVAISVQDDVIKTWGSNGVANFAEKMVLIQSSKMEQALPEEALHFFLDMIPQDTPELIEALDKIRDTPIYKKTLEKYKNNPNYRTKDGNIRFDKIKKEALAKQIAENMMAKEKQSLFSRLLDKIIAWIRGTKIQRTSFDLLEEMFRSEDLTRMDMLLSSDEIYNQLVDEEKNFYEKQSMNAAQRETLNKVLALTHDIKFEEENHKLTHIDPVTGLETVLKSTTKILGSDFYSELESPEVIATIVSNFKIEFSSVYDITDSDEVIAKKITDHIVNLMLKGEYSDEKEMIDIVGKNVAELLYQAAENRKKTLFGTAIHNIVEAAVLDKTIDIDNPDIVDPMVFNFMSRAKLEEFIKGSLRNPGIVDVLKDLIKSGHVLMTEIEVGNANLGGIIDIIAIDQNGVAHIYDFKTKFLRDEPGFKKFATLEEEFDYVTDLLSKGGIKKDDDVLPKLINTRRSLKQKYAQQLSIYKKMLMQAGISVGELTIIGVPYKLDDKGKVTKIKPVITKVLPFNDEIAAGYFPDLDPALDASEQNKNKKSVEDERVKLLDNISKPKMKEAFAKMKARLDQLYSYFKKNKDARFVYDFLNEAEGSNRVENMARLVKNFLDFYGEDGDLTNMLAIQKGFIDVIDSAGPIIKTISEQFEALKSRVAPTQEAAVQKMNEMMKMKEFVVGYQNMFQEMLGYLETTDESNPLVERLNQMVGAIMNIRNNYISTITPSVISVLGSEFTKELLDNMVREYNELITAAKQRGDKKRAEELEKERDNLPSEKVIAELLKGEMGDSGWFFSKFLPAISNPDIVIAAVAKRLKRVLDGVRLKMVAFRNEYAKEFDKRTKVYGRGVKISHKEMNASLVREVKRFTPGGEDRFELVLKNEVNEEVYYDHSKLKYELELAKKEGDKSKISDARKKLKDFEIKYFESDYTEEYYKLTRMLDTSVNYGGETQTVREIVNSIMEEIRVIESQYSTDALAEGKMTEAHMEERQSLWERYYQLMELKNADGTDKTGDSLVIAKSLREYQDNKRLLYDDVEQTSTFEKMKTKIKLKYGEDSSEYKTWLANNTRMVISEEYYEKVNELMQELASFSSNPNADRINELYKELRTIVQPFKDKDGFVNGAYISSETIEKIKNIQDEIDRLRDEVDEYTPDGYTKEEKIEKKKLEWLKYNDRINFGVDEALQLANIKEARDERLAADPTLKARVDRAIEIRKILASMRKVEYTKYYYEELARREEDFANVMGVTHAELLTDTELYEKFRETDWFKENHKIEEKVMFDTDFGKDVTSKSITPIYIWTRNVPIAEYIKEKPARHFYKRVLKDSYTDDSGKVIKLKNEDNRDILGRYKLKSNDEYKAQYGEDHKYLDKEFVALRNKVNNNTATEKERVDYENLIYFHSIMLEHQQGLEPKYRLGFAAPFREKSMFDRTIESKGQNVKSKIGDVLRGVKRQFAKTEAAESEGFGEKLGNDISKLATIDNDEVRYVPVRYTSRGAASDNSYDIWGSILNYVGSTIRKKELDKELALINGLEEILSQTENQPKGEAKNRIVDNVMKKYLPGVTQRLNLGTNTRLEVLKSFVNTVLYNEDKFEGHDILGVNTQKVVDKVMGLSSFTLLGMSPLNWTVNWLSGQVQNMVEAAGGKYYNFRDYMSAKKEIYASTKYGHIMKNMMSDFSKVGNKSFWGQIMEVFDPIQGETENEFGEKTSWNNFTNILKAGIFSGKIWGEWEIQMSSFIAFMKNVKHYNGKMYDKDSFITMKVGTDFTGMTVAEIRAKKLEAMKEFDKLTVNLLDVLELRDGKLSVKAAYETAFELGGKQFSDLVSKLHSMQKRINGSYAKFDQAYAAKSSLGRMMFFFRKYFLQLGMNRLGIRRPDFEGMTVEQGFYITFAQTMLKDLARFRLNVVKNWANYSDSERAAIRKTLTDLAFISICWMIYGLLLGYDPDDKDRLKKLREKSWASQTLVYLMLKVRSETEQFIPAPGMGLDEVKKIYSNPSILFASITNMMVLFPQLFKQMGELVGMDFPSLHYEKASGESSFKEKGDSKFIANFMQTFLGYTGKTFHPIDAIRGFEYSQRLK